jgi:iron complex outermembrane receptor protein
MNKFIPSSLAVAVALASQVAGAQQQTTGFAIEEVIVTAQKREENLQDIPVSAQAFGSEELRILGADTVAELIFAAPSLNAGGLGGSQQQMGIRGIVDYSRNPGVDPRMGVYIDEVYQGQGYSADQPLLGLESVEILRGPQGTLFGKNTVSGAINLVTKDPTEELEGEIAATYGNEGQMKGQAYVSGGLTDSLFGSIAVTYDERDGLYRNTFLNTDTGDYDRLSGRGKLRWLATDALDFTLSYDYSKRDSTEPVGTEASLPTFQTRAGFEAEDHVEFWGVGLETNFALDNGYQLVSITSYRDSEYTILGDDDMTPARIQISDFDEYNDQFTQELRIQSPSDQDFTWLAGLYYYDSERKTGRSAIFEEDLYNVLIPALAPFAEGLSGFGSVPSKLEAKSYAAFVHADWALTEDLSVTFGVRYTQDDKKVDWKQVNFPNDPQLAAVLEAATGLPLTQAPGALFGAVNTEFKGDRDENDTAPMISINYQIADSTLVYARYARAAKSGGYNAEFMLNGLENFEYDQETVDSYELGLKTTAFDDTVRLNMALFEMSFEDYQVFQFLTNASGATTLELTNAGEVTVDGVEAELTWVPTQNIRLVANATWLDAAYDEFANPGGGESFDGNDLPYAPELKYFLAAQYLLELGGGNITFDVDYTWVDDQFTDPANLKVDSIDSYGLFGARVAYAPSAGNWELAAWGRNLSDEEYAKVNNDSFLGTPRTVWGDPQLYGATFTYFLGN